MFVFFDAELSFAVYLTVNVVYLVVPFPFLQLHRKIHITLHNISGLPTKNKSISSKRILYIYYANIKHFITYHFQSQENTAKFEYRLFVLNRSI